MKPRHLLAAMALAAGLIGSAGLQAGPIGDFESELRQAYGAYRTALFQTNRNDRDASAGAMEAFASRWSALQARWKNAPPHYAEDEKFTLSLGQVAMIASKASAELGQGALSAAHETLEQIRGSIAEMRARNGITSFSDRMNAYHVAMERVLSASYGGFDPTGLGKLRESAAVLSYLVEGLRTPPAGAGESQEFRSLLDRVAQSVDKLLAAARDGNAEAAKVALAGLKQPYGLFFLKFG